MGDAVPLVPAPFRRGEPEDDSVKDEASVANCEDDREWCRVKAEKDGRASGDGLAIFVGDAGIESEFIQDDIVLVDGRNSARDAECGS